MRRSSLSSEPAGHASASRWALSFADLCLVLLGFLLLLQAHKGDPAALGQGIRSAFGAPASEPIDVAAATFFQQGEAILSPSARLRFQSMGQSAARSGATVRIESVGTDQSTRRFDAWELAAARTAAIARAISAGGLDARRVDLSIDGTGLAARHAGQHIRLVVETH